MNHINFKPFNIPVATTDTKLMYVSDDTHKWVKETATDTGVRMTAVISAVVEHAKTSEEAFTRLVGLVFELEAVLSEGNLPIPKELCDQLNELDDLYIKVNAST